MTEIKQWWEIVDENLEKRQLQNIVNAAYQANLRLGMTPKQARKASTIDTRLNCKDKAVQP